MRLSRDDCWDRLGAAPHGVLCTTRPDGRVDAVPACFAVVDDAVVSPVDRVKAKLSSGELGRVRNLDQHGGATLLCEHWDTEDWSQLWWVRARLVRVPDGGASPSFVREGEAALRHKYVQYREADSPFAGLLVFDVLELTGWSAETGGGQEG